MGLRRMKSRDSQKTTELRCNPGGVRAGRIRHQHNRPRAQHPAEGKPRCAVSATGFTAASGQRAHQFRVAIYPDGLMYHVGFDGTCFLFTADGGFDIDGQGLRTASPCRFGDSGARRRNSRQEDGKNHCLFRARRTNARHQSDGSLQEQRFDAIRVNHLFAG